MKNKTILFSILTVTLSLMLCSCNKDNPPPPQGGGSGSHWNAHNIYDTAPNPYLFKYFMFDSGSYWIYRDSIKGIFDTTLVTGTYSYTVINGIGGGAYYSTLWCNSRLNYLLGHYYIVGNRIILGFVISDVYLALGEVTDDGHFILNPKDTFFPYLTIDTTTYSEVYKLFYIKNNSSYTMLPDSGYFYMKAGMGLIKHVYYAGGERRAIELIGWDIQ